MKKYTLPFTLILILFVSFGFIKSYDTSEEPLYLDLNTTIQCIIENADGSEKDKYVRTLKVTYKDHLDKPIKLQNGDKLYNRCSFESQIVLYSESDSLVLNSWKRMSCEILSVFNLSPPSIMFLKTNQINKIIVCNTLTENCYECTFNNRNYFIDVFSEYHKED